MHYAKSLDLERNRDLNRIKNLVRSRSRAGVRILFITFSREENKKKTPSLVSLVKRKLSLALSYLSLEGTKLTFASCYLSLEGAKLTFVPCYVSLEEAKLTFAPCYLSLQGRNLSLQ